MSLEENQQHLMSSEQEPTSPAVAVSTQHDCVMHKFRLYETQSNFYMVGRNKSRTYWRVLKIDRLEPLELNVCEDSTTYTERECSDLLRRIHEGNMSTGGLKLVTTCYGVVGFIKFFGPYYMLLITKRREIGSICGHTIYALSRSEIIPLPNPAVCSDIVNSRNENRYKKLLSTLDLTKDFFFSYSYNDTHTFSGRNFKLTLIARRSRHYAGTRYLKRGVNEKGQVANDVETEQIIFEDSPQECPLQISSVVQNRGSIPLFWSQETSRLNLKPDIIVSRKDQTYQATRLHFENLAKRYGNPIIILNLIKTHEKRPRESILRAEFVNAIEFINRDLSEESHLKFIHWDLNKHSRSKDTNILLTLGKLAAYALTLTGFFYCEVTPALTSGSLKWPYFENVDAPNITSTTNCNNDYGGLCDSDNEGIHNLKLRLTGDDCVSNESHYIKPPLFQKGVLRTNCIDCLDRTNVAQYAYGLVALGEQLHALGLKEDSSTIDLDDLLADELMKLYERMGDTLAHQYGGSAAHNKIFSQRRGQWKAATQSQEFFRTLQRYYSNAYMDAEKQSAINVFLGHFKPLDGKPEVWELDTAQRYSAYRYGQQYADENARSFIHRSLSENILHENRFLMSNSNSKGLSKSALSDRCQEGSKVFGESTTDVSACEIDLSFSRYTQQMPARELFPEGQSDRCLECDSGDALDFSNFVDLNWLSSSANSCDEVADRSVLTSLRVAMVSSENIVSEPVAGTSTSMSEYASSMKVMEMSGTKLSYNDHNNIDITEDFSDSFARWVNSGETLCH
ncbi:hypothetical protein AgCh_006245 [Apium graveolens]